jgi:FAD-linked sulfhydryl oxidase
LSYLLADISFPIYTDMLPTTGIKGRFILLALCIFAALTFLFYQAPFGHLPTIQQGAHQQSNSSGAVLTGHAIAPKLGNATAKYVHQLHTTLARFPEKPTDEEKEALRSYIHLFQRLYPWCVRAT